MLGGGLTARDRALRQALSDLPASQRSFQVSSFDLPIGKSYAATDRVARAALALLTPERPTVLTGFPTLRIDHELVRLAGMTTCPR